MCSRSNFIRLYKHYYEVIFFLVVCFYHVWESFSVIFGLLILKIDLTFSNLVFPLSHLYHFVSHGRSSFLFSRCVIFCRIANFPYITASSILPKVSFFLPPPTSNKQYLYSKEIELCMWYTEEGKELENCKFELNQNNWQFALKYFWEIIICVDRFFTLFKKNYFCQIVSENVWGFILFVLFYKWL